MQQETKVALLSGWGHQQCRCSQKFIDKFKLVNVIIQIICSLKNYRKDNKYRTFEKFLRLSNFIAL